MEDPQAIPPRQSVRQKSGRGRIKKTIIIIGATIAVLGLGYEAYRVFSKSTKPDPVKQVAVEDPVQQLLSAPKDVPDAGNKKDFTSTLLNLKFTYPESWKVTETADQGIRIESSEFSYISNEEGTVIGNFRIYIRRGSRASDSKFIGRGYAIGASEKLAYANPSNDQRKDTLITKFGLDEPTNFAYFFIAGNFQLNKGDTLGPNYGNEAETFIISGGFSGAKKTDDMDYYSVATELPSSSNAYKQAVSVIASLKLN